jgi:hypothetical protein
MARLATACAKVRKKFWTRPESFLSPLVLRQASELLESLRREWNKTLGLEARSDQIADVSIPHTVRKMMELQRPNDTEILPRNLASCR